MSKIYVDQILPKDNATISAPNLDITMPAGSVIQVQSNSMSSFSTTSTTMTATGLYVDFTPKYATSKIYIDMMLGGLYFHQPGYRMIVRRDGVDVGEEGKELYGYGNSAATSGYTRRQGNMNISDFPNTTSTVRYELYARSQSGGALEMANGSSYSTIRITEIAQ